MFVGVELRFRLVLLLKCRWSEEVVMVILLVCSLFLKVLVVLVSWESVLRTFCCFR